MGNRIGRITTSGAITEFPLPTPGAGPDGIIAGPDGNLWVLRGARQPGRPHHARRRGDGISEGLTPGCRLLSPVVRDGDLWFSEYEAGQIGRITIDGLVTEYPIPTPDGEPRAMAVHPDGPI